MRTLGEFWVGWSFMNRSFGQLLSFLIHLVFGGVGDVFVRVQDVLYTRRRSLAAFLQVTKWCLLTTYSHGGKPLMSIVWC